MPDVYGPFTSAAWQQAQWFRDAYARELSGVFGSTFTATTAGELALTVSGLTVTVALGRAHVRGAGYERTGTAWSATLATNTGTNPRIDRIVLRRDLAAGTVLPTVLQGTPAATPTVPALTQVEDGVWDLPLYNVRVPAGSGTTLTNITDERVSADLGALRRNDLGTAYDETSGLITSIATGWSLTSASIRRVGLDLAYLMTRWTRTGAALTVPADGDISNVTLGTLDARFAPPLNIPMSSTILGPMALGVLGASGNIVLASVPVGATMPTGYACELIASIYPLATT